MAHNTIAIVADCDDTLAPDTTAQLLTACGVDAASFFTDRSARLVREGWDPALAYLHELMLAIRTGEIDLTPERLVDIGRNLHFYPGVPDCFTQLNREIEDHPDYRAYGIRVEFYVISAGIEEMILASPLGKAVHAMWGCSLHWDESGHFVFPKRVIS